MLEVKFPLFTLKTVCHQKCYFTFNDPPKFVIQRSGRLSFGKSSYFLPLPANHLLD